MQEQFTGDIVVSACSPGVSLKGDSKSYNPLDADRLGQLLFDVIASKRVLKTGYVRQSGGLYPTQCDTVAAHCHAVSVLAVAVAAQVQDDLRERFQLSINLEDVALMAIFHDHGEARSGDTGATSNALYGHCKLYQLERDGLKASLSGLRVEQKILWLFDDYRRYQTAEALLVHMADNLEGFEKGLHSAGGCKRNINHAINVILESIRIYRRRRAMCRELGEIADYLVATILLPGVRIIASTYELDEQALSNFDNDF